MTALPHLGTVRPSAIEVTVNGEGELQVVSQAERSACETKLEVVHVDLGSNEHSRRLAYGSLEEQASFHAKVQIHCSHGLPLFTYHIVGIF